MDEIKPFKKIPLIKYFQYDLEKIKMAYRLSDTISSDLKNIRASGDQVELAVKQFFVDKLYPKYHICDGHIIDYNLKASPQFDIIICENSKNPVLFNLADKSELVYYETVYCFGEVKKSFYNKNLIENFCQNIKRSKLELKRDTIEPNFIECSNSGFYVEENITNLPLRNPLLSFMMFINTNSLNFTDLQNVYNNFTNEYLPNFVTLLDHGIILNINKKNFEKGIVTTNLYPEYEKEDGIWVLMALEENNVLTYQYMLILEHLNNTVLSTPDMKKYSSGLFNFSPLSIRKL